MSNTAEVRGVRVVHLTSAHGPFDIRIFHKECRSLAQAGFKVIQIGNYDFSGVVDGVTIRGLGAVRGRLHRSTVRLIALAKAALDAKGDLYQIHDPELLLVALALRAAGKTVIYDIHEDLPRTVLFKAYLPAATRKPLMWIAEKLEQAAARRMSGLVAATPALQQRFAPVNCRSVAVNNYVMLEEFGPQQKAQAGLGGLPQRRTVTYYGGFSSERGINEMVRAVDLLPREWNVKLELAGTFYVEEQQREMMARPEWEHVIWHGELGRAALASLLDRAHVGLVVLHPHPAYVTSHPTKLFEYMAAGIPVIASDFPLWRSIVEGAGCGLLVDPLDPQAIASALEYLFAHPDRAREMGQRGRRAVEAQFNWACEAQTLLSFYSALMLERSKAHLSIAAA